MERKDSFIKSRTIFRASVIRDPPRDSGFEPAKNLGTFLSFLLGVGRSSTNTEHKVTVHYLREAVVGRTQVTVHAGNCSFFQVTHQFRELDGGGGGRRHPLTWCKGAQNEVLLIIAHQPVIFW